MSTRRISMYVHPWDLFDEGPEKILEYLLEAKIDTISVSTSYHAGRFILPHNPKRRIYSAEEGVSYFNYQDDYFKNSYMKPLRSQFFRDSDVMEILSKRCEELGLRISAWTVFLHNGVFAQKYPDFAIVDPFGNRDPNFICPNRTESREYITALSRNLTDVYHIASLQVESGFYPPGLPHGNHHENFGVSVDPTVSYLYSMCYCDHCLKSAKQSGFELEGKLPHIRELIDRKMNNASNILDLAPEAQSRAVLQELNDHGLLEIQEFKSGCVNDLSRSLKDTIQESHQNTHVEVVCSSESCFNQGISLDSLPDGIDGIDILLYYNDLQKILTELNQAIERVDGKGRVYPGIRITYPMIKREGQLHETIGSLSHVKTDGLNFYNYGWATQRNLNELMLALNEFF